MRTKDRRTLIIVLLVLFNSFLLFSQGKTTFYGFISREDSILLIGTTIRINETYINTFTDIEGKYSFEIPDSISGFTMLIDYVGFERKVLVFVRDTFDSKKFIIKISTDVKN